MAWFYSELQNQKAGRSRVAHAKNEQLNAENATQHYKLSWNQLFLHLQLGHYVIMCIISIRFKVIGIYPLNYVLRLGK